MVSRKEETSYWNGFIVGIVLILIIVAIANISRPPEQAPKDTILSFEDCKEVKPNEQNILVCNPDFVEAKDDRWYCCEPKQLNLSNYKIESFEEENIYLFKGEEYSYEEIKRLCSELLNSTKIIIGKDYCKIDNKEPSITGLWLDTKPTIKVEFVETSSKND